MTAASVRGAGTTGSDPAGATRPMPSSRRGVRRLGAAVVALMVVGFAVRIVGLDERALHHDESLDAWFSQRFLDGNYDGYDPVYHGPLRFYITAALYWLFGVSVASARLISVLAGTALIGVPWLLRRQLGHAGTVAAAAILCFSPTMIYYSRFAREDAFFGLLTLLLVALLIRHLTRPSPALAMGLVLTLVAAWAVKESVFLVVLVTGSWVLVELGHELTARTGWPVPAPTTTVALALLAVVAFMLGEPIVTNLAWWGLAIIGVTLLALARVVQGGADLSQALRSTRVGAAVAAPGVAGWVWALGVGAAVFVVLFTTLGTNWAGSDTASTPHNAVIDGLVGGWDYWRSQQDVNRGGEPWYYYLVTLPAYEYVTVGLAAIGAGFQLRRSTLVGRYALWASVVTLAAYSYAGERMPWLIVHPLLPLVLLAALGVQGLWVRRRHALTAAVAVVVAFGATATAVAGARIAYVDGENPRELLSQAGQATAEVADTVERVERLERLVRAESSRPLRVVVDSADSAAWPYVFSFRDVAGVVYADLGATTIDPGPDVVIAVDRNAGAITELVAGYEATTQFHRRWWVPSYTAGGVDGWWRWLVDRTVWEPTEVGGVPATVYVSPELVALEARAAAAGVD